MGLKNYVKALDLKVLAMGIIVLFPLYRLHWNSYTLLLLASILLYQNLNSRESRSVLRKRMRENGRLFFKSTLVFYPFLFSLLYTENISIGSKSIQYILPLILIPFLIFFFTEALSKKQLVVLLVTFLIGCLLHSLYLNYTFFELGLYEDFQKATFYKLPFREAVMNLSFESLHPTYVSLWYCFAIIFALYQIRVQASLGRKILFGMSIFPLLGTIVLLSSRIGFLCLLVLIPYYLLTVENRKMRILFLTCFLGLTVFSIFKISFISSRVVTEFQETELKAPIGKKHNSINIRIGIYECALALIKQNFLLGVGIGDVQSKLDSCYAKYDTDVYQNDNYNSHNYFLHVFLVAGLLGLLALLYMFFFFLRIAVTGKSFLYGSFLVVILLGMFFENILSRNHGVLFFALFNTLFVQFYLKEKNAYRGHSTLS